MSARTRLVRLLDRGFYPVELPPPFQTKRFSNIIGRFYPSDTYSGSTSFFDGATFRGVLRTFGVINPINYFLLSHFISNNWNDIRKIFNLSSSSGTRPKFPATAANGRAIEAASLAAKRSSQQHLASSYPIVLSLDVNRFYGSIYTHSIPWAILGKREAKRRFRARSLAGHWSDELDKLVRSCNQRQTVGIAIGPDTSRIISEMILSRIDFDLCAKGTGLSSNQIYHNIDDYQIGTFDTGSAENAQSQFVRTISKYELRLNDFKTSLDHGLDFSPSNFQRKFDILRDQIGRNFVEHFFELLYEQQPKHPRSNVVGYALKRFSYQLATNSEKDLVREYLQRLIFAAPHHARWILPLLLGIYQQAGAKPKKILNWGIETCARRNDVGSILWFLYAAIFLKVKLNRSTCNQCIGMSNELVDLMLFHGKSIGLFNFRVTDLRNRYLSADFQSPAWLPLYEVERRGWDTSSAFRKFGSADDKYNLYQQLYSHNVEFYITDHDIFTVEALEGWNLKQNDFGENPNAMPFGDDELPDDFDDTWENYD
jgi:hypothetical protein